MRTTRSSGAVLAALTAVILGITGCGGGNSGASAPSKAESTAAATTAGTEGSTNPDTSTFRKLKVYTVGNFPQNDTKAVVDEINKYLKEKSTPRLTSRDSLGPPGLRRWHWPINPVNRSI